MSDLTEADLEAAIVDLISRDAVEVEPYPAVALKIAELLERKDFGIGDLVKLVSSDQALSARVIRAASSTMFGMGEPINSVQAAVARLGAAEVSSLALASKLGAQARGPGLLSPLKRRIWQDSITSAFLVQKLGVSRNQPAEISFTCGLLHDFGRIVTATAIEKILTTNQGVPAQARAVQAHAAIRAHPSIHARPVEFWTEIVEKFHVQLGLLMATWWGMSTVLCEVISMHHGKTTAGCENPVVLDAVMAVDQVLAVASRLPTVEPDDLLGCTHLLDVVERELMAATLPKCPTLVEAFEGDEKTPLPNAPIQTAVAAAGTHERLQPLSISAACASNANVAYRATGIGANVLVLEGPAPLAINRLVQITLKLPQRPVTFWMNPQLCVPTGKLQRIELKPFALNHDAAQIWAGLRKGMSA